MAVELMEAEASREKGQAALGRGHDLTISGDNIKSISWHMVDPRSARDSISPRAAGDPVVAGPSDNPIVPRSAVQPIGSGQTEDPVVALTPIDDVGLRRPRSRSLPFVPLIVAASATPPTARSKQASAVWTRRRISFTPPPKASPTCLPVEPKEEASPSGSPRTGSP
jgi:hypothetical protein